MQRIDYMRYFSWAPLPVSASLLVAILFICVAPLPCRADSLNISSATASVYDGNTGQTTYVNGGCASYGGAEACANYGIDSTVSASAGYEGIPVSAGAFSAHGFIIRGPGGIQPVQVDIAGAAFANATTNATYTGGVGIEMFNDNCCTEYVLNFNYLNPPPQDFYFPTLWSSDIPSLLFQSTGCEVDSPFGSCESLIDPTIVIDPTWLASNPGYSLEEDPDEFPPPPTSATPEPGSLLLLGTGLLGLAPWLRRRASRSRR